MKGVIEKELGGLPPLPNHIPFDKTLEMLRERWASAAISPSFSEYIPTLTEDNLLYLLSSGCYGEFVRLPKFPAHFKSTYLLKAVSPDESSSIELQELFPELKSLFSFSEDVIIVRFDKKVIYKNKFDLPSFFLTLKPYYKDGYVSYKLPTVSLTRDDALSNLLAQCTTLSKTVPKHELKSCCVTKIDEMLLTMEPSHLYYQRLLKYKKGATVHTAIVIGEAASSRGSKRKVDVVYLSDEDDDPSTLKAAKKKP